MQEVLGATHPNAIYTLSDFSKKLNWGKNRSLFRIHFGISEALEVLLQGKSEQCALQLFQLLRAIHQCSLDQGSWATAWLLTHLPDPLEKPKFGGEAQEFEVVASYVKAMGELEKPSKPRLTTTDLAEEDSQTGKGAKKGKGKTKTRKPDETES